MNKRYVSGRETVVDGGALALHVLKGMTRAHLDGEATGLDALVAALGVRRSDLRRVLSALHEEGMIDLARMRLTLAGFAVGQSLQGAALAPFRVRRAPPAKAQRAA